MPTSVNAFNDEFVNLVRAVNPYFALDVGCGKGKNAFLIRHATPNCVVDGIEAEQVYIREHKLHELYNQVYNVDAKEFFGKNTSKKYDLIVMTDVIEHLFLGDAIGLVDAMLYKTKALILVWPTNLPQDNEWDSHFEMHLSNIKLSDLTRFNIVYYKKCYLESRNNVPIDMHISLIMGHSVDPANNPILIESQNVW
jgi:trans-aconitate methyltransferase